VTLDLQTGTLTRTPTVHDKGFTTCANFSNVDLGGFVGVDTGNKFCEWFDAGQTSGCSNSELIRSILFAYCSSAASVGSGGVGGSVRMGFYEGYAVGGGTPTTACAVFTLTGLPANTADSSFFGGFRCYFIRILLNPLINCANGRIAYSWHFMDVGRDGVLAATFPFLSCVQSCSGTGPDGTGMVDLIDEYCPSGVFPPRATFSFGTTPFGSYFTSISMQIEKMVGVPCRVAEFGGNSGCNKDGWLGAIKTAPPAPPGLPPLAACLGHNWGPQVELEQKGVHVPAGNPPKGHGASGAVVYKIFVPGSPNDGPCPAAPFAPYNRRVELELAAGSLGALNVIGLHNGTLGSIVPQVIPNDISFLGATWACYAEFGPPTRDRSQLVYGLIGIRGAPAETCTLLSFDAPKNPTGCVTTPQPMNRFSVHSDFRMEAEFQTACHCCEYRQFVSGELSVRRGLNPIRKLVHPLGPGVLMHATILREDGARKTPGFSGNWNGRYGHRTDPVNGINTVAKDQYVNPINRATGCKYEGKDAPGVYNLVAGEQPSFVFSFQGKIHDFCQGVDVQTKGWTVICPAPLSPSGWPSPIKEVNIDGNVIGGRDVLISLFTYADNVLTVIAAIDNTQQAASVDAADVSISVDTLTLVESPPSGPLLQSVSLGTTAHAIYDFAYFGTPTIVHVRVTINGDLMEFDVDMS